MRKRLSRILPVVAVSLALLASLANPAGAATRKSYVIKGSGSDTTYVMMNAIQRIYNETLGCTYIALAGNPQPLNGECGANLSTDIATENYYHDVATGFYPIGSSAGLSQLCAQGQANVLKIDYARSSRTPRTSDCAGLRFVAYARDAIPWATFKGLAGSATANMNNQAGSCSGSSGYCLTQAQIQGIWRDCTITNWNQVGGANAAIKVYSATKNSGTGPTFDGFIGGNSFNCIPAEFKDGLNGNGERVITENDARPIVLAGDQLTAAWYNSYGRFNQGHEAGLLLGLIDGVVPNDANIQSAVYPYSRFVYNVYRKGTSTLPANKATTDFIGEKGWMCKNNGLHSVNPLTGTNWGVEIENAISDEGFVPLPSGAIGGGVTGTSKCRVFNTPI